MFFLFFIGKVFNTSEETVWEHIKAQDQKKARSIVRMETRKGAKSEKSDIHRLHVDIKRHSARKKRHSSFENGVCIAEFDRHQFCCFFFSGRQIITRMFNRRKLGYYTFVH